MLAHRLNVRTDRLERLMRMGVVPDLILANELQLVQNAWEDLADKLKHLQFGGDEERTVTLASLKQGGGMTDEDPATLVRIYSGEWRLYWRANGCGYTDDPRDAGVYAWGDAWDRTSHCGPEKGIEYRVLR